MTDTAQMPGHPDRGPEARHGGGEDRSRPVMPAAETLPQEIVIEYHRRIDAGVASSAAELFTAAALFQGKGRELTGLSQIREFLAERESQSARHTVHVCANLQTRADADVATVLAHVLLYVMQPDGAYRLERVLDTEHRLERGASGWLISHRYSRPLHPITGVAVR